MDDRQPVADRWPMMGLRRPTNGSARVGILGCRGLIRAPQPAFVVTGGVGRQDRVERGMRVASVQSGAPALICLHQDQPTVGQAGHIQHRCRREVIVR